MLIRCSGALTLTLLISLTASSSLSAQPANDDCALATAVGEGSFALDNTGAILDGPIDCDANMSTDVWFLYTATLDGTATIDTCATLGTLDDTTLIVYDSGSACPNAGAAFLVCNDDACGPAGFNSSVTIPVLTGSSYYVQVGGWNGSTGTAMLTIDVAPNGSESGNCDDGVDNDMNGLVDCFDPDCIGDAACLEAGNCADGLDNDGNGLIDCQDAACGVLDGCEDCANTVDDDLDGLLDLEDPDCCGTAGGPGLPTNDSCATALTIGTGNTVVSSVCASGSGFFDPNAGTNCNPPEQIGSDLWFTYAPPGDGSVVIDLCTSTFDTSLVIYSGDCTTPPGLIEEECNSDCHLGGTCTAFSSFAAFPVISGVTYMVRVGGWDSAAGDVSLDLEFIPVGTEICDNFVDDDLDGTIDCGDTDCDADQACSGAVCPPTNSGVLTLNTAPDIIGGNSIACSTTVGPQITVDNEYWRSHPIIAADQIFAIRLGVENCVPGCGQTTYPITVNLYNDPTPAALLPRSDHVLLGSATAQLGEMTLETTCIPLPAPIIVGNGDQIVVEVVAEDGTATGGSVFFIGSNPSGSVGGALTYLSSAGCGLADPTDIALIGFPDMHALIDLVMGLPIPEANCSDGLDDDLDGDIDCADSDCSSDPSCSSGPLFRRGDTNTDSTINIADAVFMLNVLFPQPGTTPVFPAPEGTCGDDPTPDALECTVYPAPC